MRQIKFRAWDGEFMIEWENLQEINLQELSMGVIIDSPTDGEQLKIKIMQYTGLKDKEGKEIYEGDVVKWRDKGNIFDSEYEDCLSWVTFKYARWHAEPIKVKGLRYFQFTNYNETEDCEIIGNIYENPELLK